MRKLVAVLFVMAGMSYIAACGGSSSTSTNVTTYSVPLIFAPYSTVLGGAKQVPLVFTVPASITPVFGSSPGFGNFSSSSPGFGNISSARFNRPIALASDGVNLYVADYFNNAIRGINIASKKVTTIAGSPLGFAGSADAAGLAASFNRPSGITIAGTSLYVTDSGNFTIRRIDLANNNTVSTPAGGLGVPGSVDAVGTAARFNLLSGITSDGHSLYVTDSNNTIRRIEIGNWAVTTLAGAPGLAGSTDGDGTPASARFFQPNRLTTDGLNLYVTDSGNSTIRRIELNNNGKVIVTTIAGKAGPGGAAGTHADSTDGTGQTARFNQPNGITCDGLNLYVTDSYDNMVRKIVLSKSPGTVFSGAVTTLLQNGAASANTTMGITTDGKSLFVSDFSVDNLKHRILDVK